MRKILVCLIALVSLLWISSCRGEDVPTTNVTTNIETLEPTVLPTQTQTTVPTVIPTEKPTEVPTTTVPTVVPTVEVTAKPTAVPTQTPTEVPTTTVTTVVPTTPAPVQYTVSFTGVNVNIADIIVNEGEKVSKPADPIRDGYTFVKWVLSTTSTEFNFDTPVTSNITLNAVWNKNVSTYTVTFMSGNEVYKQIPVTEGNKVAALAAPEGTGTFLGWYESLSDSASFDFEQPIVSNLTLYAKFEEPAVQEFTLTSIGYNEGLYVTWNESNSSSTSVEYKSSTSTSWISIDKELIRQQDSKTARADIVGLKAGEYSVRVKNSNGQTAVNNVSVKETDRSGYAHFKASTGVGAYNNDGTPKSNAVIVYVSEATKNTVKATVNGKSCTGLANIIGAQTTSSNPLIIRILGTIGTSTWKPIKYSGDPYALQAVKDSSGNIIKSSLTQDQIISKGVNTLDTSVYPTLNGLRNALSYSSNEYDSVWNTLEVKEAANITLEGIGSDAELMNWGITFKKCSSIEVRNLTFTNNPEDACSFEGDTSKPASYARFWVHNNVFNRGYNSWDLTAEQDKGYGDGSTDFKGISNVTSSYNVFKECKKTGLVGGSDSNLTMSVTFHHNYYNQVGSRLPLGRQANMHFYNNYYYKCGTAQDLRANAYVLSEANYFEGTSSPQKAQSGAVIKSYNDYLTGCGSSAATVVTNRTSTLSSSCKPDGSTSYSNFDIDSTKFYYDSTNQKSDVRLLTSAQQAKEDCLKYAGVVKTDGAYPTLSGGNTSTPTEPTTNYTVSFNTNGGNSISSVTVAAGNAIGNLPTPTKSGYRFDGWYLESSYSTKVSANTVVNSNITLYAKWVSSSSTQTIEYNMNEFSTGTYTSNQTCSNFSFNATSEKNVQISECNASYNGLTFTKVLKTGGGGSVDYRSIIFTTQGACTITIYYASSGSTDRGVRVLDSNGKTLGDSELVNNSGVYAYTISIESAQTIYITSQTQGLSIYGFTVSY